MTGVILKTKKPMDNNVQSGKEILDDFFANISKNPSVDKELAESLSYLYQQGKLSDIHVKNELSKLRDKDANKN